MRDLLIILNAKGDPRFASFTLFSSLCPYIHLFAANHVDIEMAAKYYFFVCALQFSRLTVNITLQTWYRKNSIDFELSRSSSNFPYSNHIARYALELKFPFISLNIFTYGWIRITIIEVKDTAEGKNAILFMDYANFTAAARFN